MLLSNGGKGAFYAVVNNADVVSLVVVLFFPRRPLTVLWGIWPVVVDAFDGVIGVRPSPHVSDEIIERVAPPITDENSSAAVVLVIAMASLAATAADVLPSDVLGAVRKPMPRLTGYSTLVSLASTTVGPTSPKVPHKRDFLGPANAAAENFVLSGLDEARRYSSPVAELLADAYRLSEHHIPPNWMSVQYKGMGR